MSGKPHAAIRRLRATHRLSAVRVAKEKVPGLYEDGAGLRLVITDTGVKRWVLRITIRGRRVERGLGVWPLVSLEDARREADRFRRAARQGLDARDSDRAGLRSRVTFKHAFDSFFELRRPRLSNLKHVQQWQNTMRDYVFPHIGHKPVADIGAADVIELLRPIWFNKPETGARVLQRVRATFDSAILRGTREKANPCIGVASELGTKHRRTTHHRALGWQEVPAFVRLLPSLDILPTTRLLFQFLILTAARSGEARGALWGEVDISAQTWTIPGAGSISDRRTKSGSPHIVPLSSRAFAVVEEARNWRTGDVMFPARSGRALSDNTLSKLMRDAGVDGTPHGFRSAFKVWAAEHGVRDEISEAALAHVDQNKVRAAYLRTPFLAERRVVMERWGSFVMGG